MDAGIPVVCFDSGVPNAPAGSVVSTVATDNYSAGATVDLCATEASVIMNKADTIGMFGSNQVAAEGILSANDNLSVLSIAPNLYD